MENRALYYQHLATTRGNVYRICFRSPEGPVSNFLFLRGEASLNYGAYVGERSESNAANGDCAGGSNQSGTTNRDFTSKGTECSLVFGWQP